MTLFFFKLPKFVILFQNSIWIHYISYQSRAKDNINTIVLTELEISWGITQRTERDLWTDLVFSHFHTNCHFSADKFGSFMDKISDNHVGSSSSQWRPRRPMQTEAQPCRISGQKTAKLSKTWTNTYGTISDNTTNWNIDLKMSIKFCSIWCQSDPLWSQTRLPCGGLLYLMDVETPALRRTGGRST